MSLINQQLSILQQLSAYLAGKGEGFSIDSIDGLNFTITHNDQQKTMEWTEIEAEYKSDLDLLRDKEGKAKQKFVGVEFNGVMCSATSKDMYGLQSVKSGIESGLISATSFEFENGSVLTISTENMAAFMTVWVPFRHGFFPVPEGE